MEELYTTKLDSLNDQGNVICYISKSNVQVGHNNTLKTVDVSRLNDLLVSYHDNVQSLINDNLTMKADLQNTEKSLRTTRAKLESTAVELQQAKDDLAFNLRDLEQTRAKLEETGEKLEHETLLLQVSLKLLYVLSHLLYLIENYPVYLLLISY
jgi:GTP cyclohydrolase FolE2